MLETKKYLNTFKLIKFVVILYFQGKNQFENVANDKYEMPRKNVDKTNSNSLLQVANANMLLDSTYECVGPSEEEMYQLNANKKMIMKRSSSSTSLIDTPPLPPPLPPPLLKNHHSNSNRNIHRNSNDSLNESFNMNQNDGNDDLNCDEIESDSGMEVLEEPTLRPSELVRGNHNRSMSMISGNIFSPRGTDFHASK